jgi:hypothetical protein
MDVTQSRLTLAKMADQGAATVFAAIWKTRAA